MILGLFYFNEDTRQENLKRKRRRCLTCNRFFITTRVTRICGRCHKLIDRKMES